LTQPSRRYDVLIDTSGFFAALQSGDVGHERALEAMQRITDQRLRVCTSNFVIAETHALILARRNRAEAYSFLTSFDGGAIGVLAVTLEDEREARAIIERYADKDFSYTDATSFALIRRLGIASALSFDRHLLQFGVPGP
jgi:predicted nucleic acid-binding protein